MSIHIHFTVWKLFSERVSTNTSNKMYHNIRILICACINKKLINTKIDYYIYLGDTGCDIHEHKS